MSNETPTSFSDGLRIVAWIRERDKMTRYSNEDLARSLLTVGPHFGKLSDLIEIAAERMAPGIIERMAKEQELKELMLSRPVESRQAPADGGTAQPAGNGGKTV